GRGSAGPGRSGPTAWTRRGGATSGRCCPSRNASARSTGGAWRSRRGRRPVRAASWPSWSARRGGQAPHGSIGMGRVRWSGGGLGEGSEFEPRVTAARQRLARLEEEHKRRADEEGMEAELRLVIGRLEEFASRVSEGLEGADWSTRREIIRALVKRVEVDENEARIVYRVSPSPFEDRPQQALLQHCWGRSCASRPLSRSGQAG